MASRSAIKPDWPDCPVVLPNARPVGTGVPCGYIYVMQMMLVAAPAGAAPTPLPRRSGHFGSGGAGGAPTHWGSAVLLVNLLP